MTSFNLESEVRKEKRGERIPVKDRWEKMSHEESFKRQFPWRPNILENPKS